MAEDQANSADATTITDGQAPPRQVSLQRIFCKDASLEVPLGPEIFKREWKPEISVQVNTNVNKLESDIYHVTLILTVTAKLAQETAYLVEAHEGGIFQLSGFTDQTELGAVLGAYCPSVIFPFARETISNLTQRGGFPPLLLQPINFDFLYAQHVERSEAQAANTAPETPARIN